MSDMNDFVWAEKWRPKTIDECILPAATKTTLKEFVASGTIPHFLLSGGAGVGKTTVARALANELNADLMFINASLESGVDVVRTKIVQFASTVSFGGGMKIILLDEADYLSANSQASLRGVIEEFGNVRFIFTCNYRNRIIDAIVSRTSLVDFKISNEERPKVASRFFKRVLQILDTEGVKYEHAAVAELINKHFPDFRKVLSELQKYSSSGKIDSGILLNQSKESFKVLFDAMKTKNFTEVRKWVGMNSDVDAQVLFRDIYDNAYELMAPQSIPRIVILLADYSFKAANAAVDQEIMITAAMTEIMVEAEWKN